MRFIFSTSGLVYLSFDESCVRSGSHAYKLKKAGSLFCGGSEGEQDHHLERSLHGEHIAI